MGEACRDSKMAGSCVFVLRGETIGWGDVGDVGDTGDRGEEMERRFLKSVIDSETESRRLTSDTESRRVISATGRATADNLRANSVAIGVIGDARAFARSTSLFCHCYIGRAED